MKCYLCESKSFSIRTGQVRDKPELKILECKNCGLVTLDSQEHIGNGFYEESGMHIGDQKSIDSWLNETYSDDKRRLEMVRAEIVNKKILDFGCGAAGFLKLAKELTLDAVGIEIENRVIKHWGENIKIFPAIKDAGTDFDLVTAFHVLEHLHDPRATLKKLSKTLRVSGRIIIEVPSSDDALITLYNCLPFQRFTYWSQHLYLFNAQTIKMLATQAGLHVVAVKHHQRYPISNHLYWQSQGKPGGHKKWGFLDTPELNAAYQNSLAAIGKTDTIIAYLEAENVNV